MTTTGQQLHETLPSVRGAEIIWLREAYRPVAQVSPAAIDTGSPVRIAMPGLAGLRIGALALLAAGGQAAALLPIFDPGGGAHPWFIAALFGIGAAVAAQALSLAAGRFRRQDRQPRPVPDDLALHDAFTLALVIAASADAGAAAILLLPAGVVLSHVMQRGAKRRSLDGRDAILIAAALIAISGASGTSGLHGWIAGLTALTGGGAVRAVYKSSLQSRLRPAHHKWAVTAVLCAAVVATRLQSTAFPLDVSAPVLLALVWGTVYGAAAQLTALKFSRFNAQLISAAVPFLAFAVLAAASGTIRQEEAAAAVLLAGLLVISNPGRKAAARAQLPDRSPLGWSRWG